MGHGCVQVPGCVEGHPWNGHLAHGCIGIYVLTKSLWSSLNKRIQEYASPISALWPFWWIVYYLKANPIGGDVQNEPHYNDVITSAVASQITSLTIVYSTVYSGADQRKYQSSASLAFVRGIHQWPVTQKCFLLMTLSWDMTGYMPTWLAKSRAVWTRTHISAAAASPNQETDIEEKTTFHIFDLILNPISLQPFSMSD